MVLTRCNRTCPEIQKVRPNKHGQADISAQRIQLMPVFCSLSGPVLKAFQDTRVDNILVQAIPTISDKFTEKIIVTGVDNIGFWLFWLSVLYRLWHKSTVNFMLFISSCLEFQSEIFSTFLVRPVLCKHNSIITL